MIKFNNYKKCLLNGEIILKSQQRFISNKHDVYTEDINKIALTLFRMGFLIYVKRMGWGKITPPGLFLIGFSYQAYFCYITSLSYLV